MNNGIPLEIKSAFAESLLNSFTTTPQASERDGLSITTNGLDNERVLSTDQWAGHNPRTTGGQEIIKVGAITYTRVYAGGTIEHSKIEELGIIEKDIMIFLSEIVNAYAERIRLDEDFAIVNGGWQYHYECTSNNPNIPMWLGEEVIYYQNQLVFQHNFTICPVES